MAWLLFTTQAQKSLALKLSLRLHVWMLENGFSKRNQNTRFWKQREPRNSLTTPLLQPLPQMKSRFQKSLINLHILIESLINFIIQELPTQNVATNLCISYNNLLSC